MEKFTSNDTSESKPIYQKPLLMAGNFFLDLGLTICICLLLHVKDTVNFFIISFIVCMGRSFIFSSLPKSKAGLRK